MGVRVRLSLSLYLYRSLVLALALSRSLFLSLFLSRSRSLRACDCGSQCGLGCHSRFSCPWRQSRRVFSERAVLWAHWNFLGLCFVLCLHISRFLCFRHLWMRMFVLIFQLWCAKKCRISNMFALGRLNMAHCGLCLPHRKSNGNTARVIEDRHWKYNAHAQ